MNNFYKFIPGEIKGEKIDKNIFAYNIKIGKFIFYMLGIILSFCLIHVVFSKTINELTLENTISLGAVFATLGSAIVASASLYCNDCYTKFSDNVNTLQNDFAHAALTPAACSCTAQAVHLCQSVVSMRPHAARRGSRQAHSSSFASGLSSSSLSAKSPTDFIPARSSTSKSSSSIS